MKLAKLQELLNVSIPEDAHGRTKGRIRDDVRTIGELAVALKWLRPSKPKKRRKAKKRKKRRKVSKAKQSEQTEHKPTDKDNL